MKKYPNSITPYREAELVISNLERAVKHIEETQDIHNPETQERLIKVIKKIRVLRAKIMAQYVPAKKNLRFHCTYKHLLVAYDGYWEKIEADITKGVNIASSLMNAHDLGSVLHEIRKFYFNIHDKDLSKPNCEECFNDAYNDLIDEEEQQKAPKQKRTLIK